LTVITKDADFSHRIVLHTPPPRVIHVRIGNVSLRDLFGLMTMWWPTAQQLSATHKLVTIFANHIEAVA
jgi:predicted nuclease of predicted toxin-antitoxin system